MSQKIQLESNWKEVLIQEFEKPYMQKLKAFLIAEKNKKKIIYPSNQNIFKAFELTPFNSIKVVIIGQDPYHGPNQAHGLCFSVLPGVAIPPSLLNIYKELTNDAQFKMVSHGYLKYWAQQGVFLLNSVLTVEQGLPGSHQGKGWELFTNAAIAALNNQHNPIIFVLWGSYAQKKGDFINQNKHIVLQAAHPSPLSAYRGFFGCKHFSKINNYLSSWGKNPIDWQLPAQ